MRDEPIRIAPNHEAWQGPCSGERGDARPRDRPVVRHPTSIAYGPLRPKTEHGFSIFAEKYLEDACRRMAGGMHGFRLRTLNNDANHFDDLAGAMNLQIPQPTTAILLGLGLAALRAGRECDQALQVDWDGRTCDQSMKFRLVVQRVRIQSGPG